jgi:hypothetical protein
LAGFAAAHSKAMGFPEWSVDFRHDGHGLGDDPSFIHNFHAWITSNNTAFANIFAFDAPDQQNNIADGSFPNALSAFKTDFGGSSASLAPHPSPAPSPAPVPAAAPVPVIPRPQPRPAPAPALLHAAPAPPPAAAAIPRLPATSRIAPSLPPISAILRALASRTASSSRRAAPAASPATHRASPSAGARALSIRSAGSTGPLSVNVLGLAGMFLVGGLLGLAIAYRTGRSQPKHAIRGQPIYARYALLAR